MNRERLDSNIEVIRRYTAADPELRKAHHFLYDLPLDKSVGTPEVVVMGINPGETQIDRDAYDGPTEETWSFDFHEHAAAGRSLGSKRWRKLTQDFVGEKSVIFTEFFFWSSNNQRELVARFGPLWTSPHINFCIKMNQTLIEAYQPKAVIFVGLSGSKKVANEFGLRSIHTLKMHGHRLVDHYQDEHRPWLFTKHWTGSRGFTTPQKHTIKSYLHQHL